MPGHEDPQMRRPRPDYGTIPGQNGCEVVFSVDVLQCPKCHGRMRVLTAIHSPEAIQAILKCLGLPGRSPPIAPPDPRDSYADSFFDVC